jgi:hypothetical protein
VAENQVGRFPVIRESGYYSRFRALTWAFYLFNNILHLYSSYRSTSHSWRALHSKSKEKNKYKFMHNFSVNNFIISMLILRLYVWELWRNKIISAIIVRGNLYQIILLLETKKFVRPYSNICKEFSYSLGLWSGLTCVLVDPSGELPCKWLWWPRVFIERLNLCPLVTVVKIITVIQTAKTEYTSIIFLFAAVSRRKLRFP